MLLTTSTRNRRRFVGRSDDYLATVFDAEGAEYLRLPRPIAMLAVPVRRAMDCDKR